MEAPWLKPAVCDSHNSRELVVNRISASKLRHRIRREQQ